MIFLTIPVFESAILTPSQHLRRLRIIGLLSMSLANYNAFLNNLKSPTTKQRQTYQST